MNCSEDVNNHKSLWTVAKTCELRRRLVDSGKKLVDSGKDLWTAAKTCELQLQKDLALLQE